MRDYSEVTYDRELKLRRFDRLWQAGEILDNTYLRSLFIVGLLPDEARSRLSCLRMDKMKHEAR